MTLRGKIVTRPAQKMEPRGTCVKDWTDSDRWPRGLSLFPVNKYAKLRIFLFGDNTVTNDSFPIISGVMLLVFPVVLI